MPFYEKKVWLKAESAREQARNIYCVGRNYRDHATELGNAVPTTPMLFGKWTHALVACPGRVHLPKERTNIHHELEIVLWLARPYEEGLEWHEYVGGIALGLDLTDRESQSRLKSAGHPWEYAKSFKASAVITDFYRVTDWAALTEADFSLVINDRVIQSGTPADMVFSFETLIDYIGREFGFGAGDIVYTGTPAGVGPLKPGDEVAMKMRDDTWGTCSIL